MYKCLFSFILFFCCTNLFAQLTYFRNVDRTSGLPLDFVYTIAGGAEGYLWVGTGQGFSKYNGSTVYATKDIKLPQNTASASFFSTDSTQWFGYYNGTIAQLKTGADTAKVFTDLFTEKISAIIEANYGAIFFIGQKGSIGRYYKDNFIVLPPPEDGLIVYDAIHISDTEFYLASEKGLLVINFTADSYTYAVQDEAIFQHLYKTEDFLFAGGREGITSFDLYANGNKSIYPTVTAVNDLQVENQHLWVATNGEGLLRFDDFASLTEPTQFTTVNGLASNYIQCLGFDRENNLWAGTSGAGMSLFLGDAFSYQYQNLADKGLNTVLANKSDNLWIGTEEGLFSVSYNNQEEFLKGENITAVHVDQAENIWVGINGSGLKVKLKGEKTFTDLSIQNWPNIRYVNFIQSDRKGNIWLATRLQGVIQLDLSSQEIKQYNTSNILPHNNIHQILSAEDGKVWIASSDQGIGYISNGTFTKITSNEILNRYEINCIEEAKDGKIWLGSNGGGLFRYEPDSIYHYTEKEGLLSQYINTIGKDQSNNLWVGGVNGLNVLYNDTQEFVPFDTKQLEWSSLKIRKNAFTEAEGNTWLITDSGLLNYQVKKHSKKAIKPIVNLKSVAIDGEEVKSEVVKDLPYGDYRLKFDFEAIAFKDKENLQFRYQLYGLEKNWSDFAIRDFAEYPILSAGNYTLKLQVKDVNGLTSNETSILTINIATPFWQKPWFYILVFFLLLGIAYSIHQIRLSRLKKANKKLTIKVAEKTEALAQEKEKLEEAYKKLLELEGFKESLNSMIVHDLKNPLNLIITLSEQKTPVHEAGRQMLNMVLNILDVNRFEEAKVALHIQDIRLIDLLNRAIGQVSVIMHQKHIHLENKLNKGLHVEADPEIFVRVMVNLLSNAAKYSPAGSKVVISAKKDNDNVFISVKDNGYGIPANELPFIFDKFRQADNHREATVRSSGLGLTFCKLAVEAHGGVIQVNSTENEGSVFTFSVKGKQTEGEIIREKHDSALSEIPLRDEDIKVLISYMDKFHSLEVYDTSANIELINTLPDTSDNLIKWKEALLKAVLAFHEQRYNDLLNQLKQAKDY